MNINERNIRIDSALRAAVKIGALSSEEYDAACQLITKGEIEAAPIAPAADAQTCGVDVAPLNGIPATLAHDEGAIARCSYCGRYSLDPKTLGDRQPKCECGEKFGWSGSFKKPGPDAEWSGSAPSTLATGKVTANAVDERAAFEAWAGNPPVEFENRHADRDSFWCWQAWQARAALAQPSDAAAEPVAYTTAERLKKIAERNRHVDTMWPASMRDGGDIPLYTAPQAPSAPATDNVAQGAEAVRIALTEAQIEKIAHYCETEAHACPGTNMWMCAHMAVEETLRVLAEPYLHLQIAEVCEDADGTKHIEAVIEDLDDLPKGMRLYAAPQDASAPAVDALTTGAVGFRTRQPGFAWVPWLTDDQETIRKAIQDAIDHGAEGEALYANPAPSPKVPSVEQPLSDEQIEGYADNASCAYGNKIVDGTHETYGHWWTFDRDGLREFASKLQSAHTAGGQS